MDNNEFYSANEIKKINEFKQYKAEVYRKSIEINKTASEHASTGKEYTFASNKKNPTNEKKGGVSKLVRKVAETTSASVSTVVTTATAVVASAAIIVTAIIKDPRIEILEFGATSDTVSYHLNIEELNPNVEYQLIISDDEIIFYTDILEEGENFETVTGLTPDTEYELSVIGVNINSNDSKKYIEKRFKTDEAETYYKVTFDVNGGSSIESQYVIENNLIIEPEIPVREGYIFLGWFYNDVEFSFDTHVSADITLTARWEKIIVFPDNYDGIYEIPSASDLQVSYKDENYYLIKIPFNYSSTNDDFMYRITLMDSEGVTYSSYTGKDLQYEYKIPKEVDQFIIKSEFIAIIDGKENIYEMSESDIIHLSTPKLEINSVEMVETGKYRLFYTVNSDLSDYEVYNFIDFLISYNNLEEYETINVKSINANENSYIDITNVGTNLESMQINATLNLGAAYGHEEMIVSDEYEYVFERKLILDSTVVDFQSYTNEIRLKFNYHLFNGETIIVRNANDGTEYSVDGDTCYIEILEEGSTYNLVYYVTSSEGAFLTEEQELTVNATRQSGEYTFNYKNPGEILKTYNDDGTQNFYIDLNFESQDPDIYYEIILINYETGNINYKSTNRVASIEDLPHGSYSIEYNVYKKHNDCNYLLMNVYPSGSTDEYVETYIEYNFITDEQLQISIYNILQFDTSNIKIITDVGEIEIIKSDIIFNEETHMYEIIKNIDLKASTFKLIIYGSQYSQFYDIIAGKIEIKGNKYKVIEIELFKL